jgi:fructose-bisphosphate aldolase class I
MARYSLEETAQALVAEGKGILAADETVPTISKRFQALSIVSTTESRRDYRHMLITTPDLSKFVSGVILYDETIRQAGPTGTPLVELTTRAGIIPGIKVDAGTKPLAACRGELVTEGLDGLRDRLREYDGLGARFAKWRAVIRVTEQLPSDTCLWVNAHALARYAALCQEQGLVPIVEPEVLMDGAHTLARAEEVTTRTLELVFRALRAQRVTLEGMLLKPNMVVAGKDATDQPSVAAVAAATLRVLRRQVPAAVPGVVFLSGGQDDRQATAHLNAINCATDSRPWRISFSYGRALQDPALEAWGGRAAQVQAGQKALYHRALCNGAASLGTYDPKMDAPAAGAARHDWADEDYQSVEEVGGDGHGDPTRPRT